MAKHHDEVAMPMEYSRNGQETSEDRLVRAFNDRRDELIEKTVRYCVVLQTLERPPQIEVT